MDSDLDPYRRALSAFPGSVASLRAKLDERLDQGARITRIEHLFEEWRRSVAEKAIAARRQQPPLTALIARGAHIQLLRAVKDEAEYRAGRRNPTREHWQKTIEGMQLQLASALGASSSPEQSNLWRRALSLLSDYHRGGLSAEAGSRPGGPLSELEALLREQAEATLLLEQQVLESIGSRSGDTIFQGLQAQVAEFLDIEEKKLAEEMKFGEDTIYRGTTVALSSSILALALGLMFAQRVSLSILRAVDSVTRAAHELAVSGGVTRLEVASADELGQMALSFNTMASRLAARNREVDLMHRTGELLQACVSIQEAFAVVARMVPRLFPDEDGALLWISESGRTLEQVISWHGAEFRMGGEIYAPEDCWALRRGDPHGTDSSHPGLVCIHVGGRAPRAYTCFPMLSGGRALGTLHLRSRDEAGDAPRAFDRVKQALGVAVSEQIALALGNLKLRATLHSHSVRDSLTGLFNRRYMEETFEREVRKAERTRRTLGVILVDIDHFKWFNDDFGHEAGDAVLRDVSLILKESLRKEDFACRYGGEEIVLVMTEASLEAVRRRAEEIREAVKHFQPVFAGRPLGSLSISLGVAAYPTHGETVKEVLRSADAALYHAKALGRDRVVVAESSGRPPVKPEVEPARARRSALSPKPPVEIAEA
jgi:diguanylate cyclase (GGDEF)-like protein